MKIRKTKTLPPLEALRSMLIYLSETGELIEASSGLSKYNDSGAGYHGVCIFGKQYLAHRIIWKLVHGVDPVGEVDHINGNRRDNRAVNLRLCWSFQNNRNRRMSSRNKTGVKGISWEASRSKWRATVDQTFLGRFSDLEEAKEKITAYRTMKHGHFANHGLQTENARPA